ncbi:MAG: hypothetical protein ACOYON_10605 [Fimbriimonas sp.]
MTCHLLAAVILLAIAGSQQEPEFALIWKPVQGQELNYAFTMKVDSSEGKFEIRGDTLMKVTKIEENGDYTVESSSKNQKVAVDGHEEDLDDDPEPEVTKYTAKGQKIPPKDAKEDEEGPDPLAVNILDPITDFASPAGPIKKGTTWTEEYKADEKLGRAACKVVYEVIGAEKRGEYDCVRLSAKLTQTEGGSPAKAEGHFLISTKDTTLVDFVINVEGFRPEPAAPSSSVTFSLIRK